MRLATEAAPQSPWGRVLKVFNQALVSKTGGAYTIDAAWDATFAASVSAFVTARVYDATLVGQVKAAAP